MTSDEWYTPRSAVVPIIEHLKPNSRVLCPFDTEKSNFVKEFKERGFQVTHSHISEGTDFFTLPKPDVDYVISNPPFSEFDRILTRLYEWNIPFAMVWTTQRLFDSRFRMQIAEGGCEVLFLYPRIAFLSGEGKDKYRRPNFQSCYWCRGILPKQILFAEIEQEQCEGQISIFDMKGEQYEMV